MSRNVLRWPGLSLALFCSLFTLFAQAENNPPLPPDHAQRMTQGLEIFKTTVGPLLKDNCLKCHGGEGTRAELDLRDREGLLKGSLNGPVITLWNADASRLMRLVNHQEKPHMPHKADKLPPEKIKALAEWINSGAPYEAPLLTTKPKRKKDQVTDEDRKFWSFQPLKPVAPPRVKSKQVENPIDQFIVAALSTKKLSMAPPADKRVLLRRVHLDLTGIPPTAEETAAFLADRSADAYEKVVDRLLGSPRFGERWARHWLDAARFGESHGFEQDYDRPHAYWYRDFVIKAFNDDMPYTQFVQWQLAGDELAPDQMWAMAATGFLGAGVFPTQLTEAEFESARYEELDNMAGTVGTAMLGLTVGCARCHDHKFDPIPTRDYYRFITIFGKTIRSEVEVDLATSTINLTPAPASAKTELPPTIKRMMVTTEGLKPLKHHADERGFPHFYQKTYFLRRGDTKQKQDEMAPGFLQVLSRGIDTENWQQDKHANPKTTGRRAELAQWMVDTNAGAGDLLARVIVNRLWHHHFGRGIVSTPNDFGVQGERPTHPELLDWLAGQLQANGWHLKPIHKMIVMSGAYRQSTRTLNPPPQEDPENHLMWSWNRRRLEAEPLRDSILFASRLLDESMGGPGTLKPDMKRRSIYFFIKRSELVPALMLFDAPEPTVSVGNRVSTTIAPQALYFLNNPQVRQASVNLAELILKGSGKKPPVAQAYLKIFGRSPTREEMKTSDDFISEQKLRYGKNSVNNPDTLALADLCQVLFSSNEFVYVD